MERWAGKVAVVTGASSGIGAATVKELVKAGMVVIGLARRAERVEALKSELGGSARNRLHAMKCDVSKEEEILRTFQSIEQKFGGVDVLINNAGITRQTNLIAAGNTNMLREVIDTNVMGLVMCSREAFQSMKKRSVDGHIVHINSIAGHHVPPIIPHMNIYPASKFAVTAIAETMRHELRTEGTKIKVTSISPGVVQTEILPQEVLSQNMPMLEAVDIANAILYVLGTPPRVQVHELTIKPVGETF
ncbi:farnesol dehydrogenase-like [Toxorhynchites rutilus septentrionalis]|uniref:farnesol dehydrogenase-like n=1 Tax=Toxorhynchites rutilus septentrionalis TaxID=329112 RepID=UPI0024784DEF|nr:farnesol dehydrogenase-like [Toxorhynchites rutilus septentrionalis]